jgi:maleylacetoacetate isomerase
MADFVLYSYFRSSASYRVRIALNLKGLAYEYKAVHLLNDGGEQHKPEYLALNPARQVPTLVHGRHVIAQSMAILEYLDGVHPSPRLFPQDPYKKAQVIQFCENINCTQPLQNLATTQYLSSAFHATEGQKQAWIHFWLGRGFEATEKMLEKNAGTYCCGGEVTAADCFLVPQVFAARRFNVDLTPYPNVLRVHAALEELAAFEKAHPTRQPDTPAEMRA